jgi:hypothetical protein
MREPFFPPLAYMVMVMKLRSNSGDMNWLEQIGTPGDERLASLAVDDSDNAIVYGDSFFIIC